MLHPNESLATSTSLSSGMADLSIRFLTSAGTGCHLRLLVAQRGELLLLLPLKVLIPRSLPTADQHTKQIQFAALTDAPRHLTTSNTA